MLQINKSASIQVEEGGSTHDVPYPAQPSLADQFAKVIGFIRRQFPVVLSVVPLTIGLAAVYLFTTPPLYSGQAKIMIDTGKVQLLPRSILAEDPVNPAMMESQLEILNSENFALSIVKNLHLTQDPEFVGPNRGLIGIARNVISKLFISNENEAKSELELTRRAVHVFQDRLTVSRVGLAYVIEIRFQSIDPDRAAQIANAVADGYIADQLDAKFQTIRGATAWLQDRLNELRGQASAAERAVIDYKTKNNIVDTGGRLIIDEQQLGELNTCPYQGPRRRGRGAGAARSRLADPSQRRSRNLARWWLGQGGYVGYGVCNGHGNVAKPRHHSVTSALSRIRATRGSFFQ